MANDIAPQTDSTQQLLADQEARFELERQEYQTQIRHLQESLLKLKKQLFGPRSEKLQVVSSNQASLFEHMLPELEETEDEAIEVKAHKKKKRKNADLKELPRERIEYLPEETSCSDCGKELVRIGEDVREEIEHIPAQTLVREHVSVKLGCSCCKDKLFAGTIPDSIRILDRCKFGAGLLAKIVVSKYVDALPLYRQVEIFARGGLETNRATLSRYVLRIAELLSPIAEALRRDILLNRVIYADETPFKRQCSEKEGLKQGYLWGVLGPPGVYFRYDDSRSATMTKKLLGEDYEGLVHGDHYVSYEPQYLPEGALRVGCWAHVRRKYVEAVTIDTKRRDAVLKQIATIYREDKKLKRLSPEEKLAKRVAKLKPLFDDLKRYLENLRMGLLKSDGLHEAIGYTLNQWTELTRILEYPGLDLDNNAIERQMKPIALGKKNYLCVSRRAPLAISARDPCCILDGGWPSGQGFQEH